MKLILTVTTLAGMLSACGSTLSQAGREVRVVKQEPAEGCEELGPVSGSGGGGGFTSTEAKLESARNELRNEAAKMGANLVVMDMSGSDESSVAVSGRAFRCGNAPARRPEAVTVEPADAPRSAEERIRELQGLRDKGLITNEEYEARRQAILDSI